MRRQLVTLFASVTALLGGCDMIGGALGIESPEKVAAVREADGRAIGGACRHAGRAIEDCYTLNKKADRAAVFAGWRDMNDYMRENKIDAVAPMLTPGTQIASNSSKTVRDSDEAKTPPASDKSPEAASKSGEGKSRDGAAKSRGRDAAKSADS